MRNPLSEESFVKKLNNNLTTSQRRAHESLQEQTSRMWRNFWIRIAHQEGYTNVAIAKEFEIAESTVRSILSK